MRFTAIIIIATVCLFTLPAFAIEWRVDVSPAISDHGNAAAAGSLANILAKIGTQPATVILTGAGRYPVKTVLTVPDTVELAFQRGAVLVIDAQAKVTINGHLQAGPWPIFAQQGRLDGAAQNPTVLPQWFGAAGDGRADDTRPLQQAVDFACTSEIRNVDLGRGRYRLTKTLDCTNLRLPGTIVRDGLEIHGSSFSTTALIGETGDGAAVIETSGSQWLELRNFVICQGEKNPSTVGIFAGVPKALPQCQNQFFHVYLSFGDNMKANDGFGTIGIWNFAAEEHTYQSVYIHANRPVVLSAFNNFPNYSGPLKLNYRKSYVELLQVHSLGMTTFSGECFLLSQRAPAVTTQCINSLSAQNLYIGGQGDASHVAFDIYGSLVNLTYSGTVEGMATFMRINGSLVNANVGVTFGGMAGNRQAPLLELGANGMISGSDIKFAMEADKDRKLLGLMADAAPKAAPVTAAELNAKIKEGQVDAIAPAAGLTTAPAVNAAIINTRMITTLEDQFLVIPAAIRAHSRHSTIAGQTKVIELK